MRRVSKRRAERLVQVKAFRESFKAEIGRCELCLKKRKLDLHEIARGSTRQAALDKRYAILGLCRSCHDKMEDWTRAKQLALLRLRRPQDYDLPAFHKLVGRNWPYEEDVNDCRIPD